MQPPPSASYVKIFGFAVYGGETGASGKYVKLRDEHSRSDRISSLPNELLLSILSHLSLKEASATSILSRRWRYMWTFTPKLDFDASDFFQKVRLGSWLHHESLKYVEWVDDVLGLHMGSAIEELGVCFYLTKAHKKYIDRWLRFALARKVQRLELNLECCVYDECYTFPYELLCSHHSHSWGFRNPDLVDFKHLRRICMHCVSVSDEALEFFLCTCPLLEELSVSCSGQLTALKIIAPFPAFKCLEISYCKNLNSVEIRDANLVFLKYCGIRIQQFLLKNVPLLVEMFVGGALADSMRDFLLMLSSYLPQLEKLTIDRIVKFSNKEAMMFYLTVKMSNLKQLVFKFAGVYVDTFGFNLLPLTSFIRASPFLQRFVLEAYGGSDLPEITNRVPEKFVGSYPHLKQVEFVGYRGVSSEVEMVVHLLENAVALEEVIIDVRKRDNKDFLGVVFPYSEGEMNAARAHVKEQLTKSVPSRVHLKIL